MRRMAMLHPQRSRAHRNLTSHHEQTNDRTVTFRMSRSTVEPTGGRRVAGLTVHALLLFAVGLAAFLVVPLLLPADASDLYLFFWLPTTLAAGFIITGGIFSFVAVRRVHRSQPVEGLLRQIRRIAVIGAALAGLAAVIALSLAVSTDHENMGAMSAVLAICGVVGGVISFTLGRGWPPPGL